MMSWNETFFSDRQATYLLHKSEGFWDSTIKRRHWHLSNVFDTADLATAAEMMEHMGNGLVVLDAGLGAYNVYETWKEGGDWEYEMLQDTIDIGAAVFIGTMTALAFAAFLGGGWVVCLVAGVVAGAVSWAADYFGNPLLRRNFKPMLDKLSEKAHI